MRIKIIDRFFPSGKIFYEWWLYDGPDGIEKTHGYATDLVTAFSKIMEWHERIGQDYAEEVIKDLDTLKTFLNNDETN